MFYVSRVAKLVRIGFSKEEEKRFSKELEAILEFVSQLQKVNTDNIEPISHITGLVNVTREDWPKEKEFREEDAKRADKMLKIAPETKNNYVKVKAIL
ncbi:MAG: Asp-tRNA(Asn)/Glu-tRNA(Gln) amidotransferase subunit GatC [Parcubacteria group bacterium]|nr:Asp-tRNA(Asn)/Glu-tRNA(Gln) amidotransferase subunit GatC [Parcubacteria group bacterium]